MTEILTRQEFVETPTGFASYSCDNQKCQVREVLIATTTAKAQMVGQFMCSRCGLQMRRNGHILEQLVKVEDGRVVSDPPVEAWLEPPSAAASDPLAGPRGRLDDLLEWAVDP